jgi:hypothetical protein
VLGLTSRPAERADPTQIAAALRKHWSIENGLHDVVTSPSPKTPPASAPAPAHGS